MKTAPECSTPIVVLTPIGPSLIANQPNTLHVLVRVQEHKAQNRIRGQNEVSRLFDTEDEIRRSFVETVCRELRLLGGR